MSATPKISIIIPVYKAEAYLRRCVDSILSQTFTDWELILVDDGSPDRSGSLCDEIAKSHTDLAIKVIHKANGGVSSAREEGMRNAVGLYSIHIDPDDWIENDMLEALYSEALSSNADIVASDFIFDYGSFKVISCQKPSPAVPYLKQLLMQDAHGSLCNKLIKTELYRRFDIHFPADIICWEDLYVCCILALNDCAVSYVPKAFYHYDLHSNDNSMARKVSLKTVEGMKQFCRYFEAALPPDRRDWLFGAKASVLVSQYRSGLFSDDEIRTSYPEINEQFIQAYYNDRHKVMQSATARVLRGKSLRYARRYEKAATFYHKVSSKLRKFFK